MEAGGGEAVGVAFLGICGRIACGTSASLLMVRPVPKSQKHWIKALLDLGWELERGGNHQVKMTKPGCRPITLPDNHRRAYGKGLEAQLRRELKAAEKGD